MELINMRIKHFYRAILTRPEAISKELYTKAGDKLYHKILNDLIDIEDNLIETLNI